MIPLLGEEIILEVIMSFIYPFSRIPVPIFSHCMRGHVASCCRKEGTMQKRKKKKVGRNRRQMRSTRETGTLDRYHTVWLCLFAFARSFPLYMYI